MGKNKAQAPTLPRIRYISCFDLTHAPVATAACAAATGLLSGKQPPRNDRTSVRNLRVLYGIIHQINAVVCRILSPERGAGSLNV